MSDLQKLYDAILEGDAKAAQAVTEQALAAGVDPLELVTKYMVPAMDEVGRRFECEEYFVPGAAHLRPRHEGRAGTDPAAAGRRRAPSRSAASPSAPSRATCTISARTWSPPCSKAAASRSSTSARTSPRRSSSRPCEEKGANIVCLSALLTMTMPAMKTTIEALRAAGVRDKVKVMVGGAPVTPQYADGNRRRRLQRERHLGGFARPADGRGRSRVSGRDVHVAPWLLRNHRDRVAQTLVSAAPRLVSALGPSLDTSVEAARKSACATPRAPTRFLPVLSGNAARPLRSSHGRGRATARTCSGNIYTCAPAAPKSLAHPLLKREISRWNVECTRQARMKLSVLLFSCALLPLTASAQLLTFGLQGGIPSQTPLGQTDDKMPFVLGPTADVRLFSGLSLSTGVLFSRAGRLFRNSFFTYREDAFALNYNKSQSHATEVPLLAKYRFLDERRGWRPFLSAGATIRRTSIETSAVTSVVGGNPVSGFALLPVLDSKTVSWNADPTAGVGVDFRSGRFHLEPEIRYSYWGAGKHTLVRKNQVHFLLGFRF